ncbi:MAG: hypothetical protein AB1765_10210 [Candidatus Hydrogenedentota bacterium]
MKRFNFLSGLITFVLILGLAMHADAAKNWKAKTKDKTQDPKITEYRNQLQPIRDEIKDLVKEYRKASESDKPAIKTQIRDKVSEMFDIRIQMLEYRISAFQTKVNEIKTNKDSLIDQKLDKFLSKSGNKKKNKD